MVEAAVVVVVVVVVVVAVVVVNTVGALVDGRVAVVVESPAEVVGSERLSGQHRHSGQPDRGSIIVTLCEPGRQRHGRNVVVWQCAGTVSLAVVAVSASTVVSVRIL